MAYQYKRSINIDHTQVPSTQSNFGVLVKLDATNSGTTMKTVANGGHIQNTVTQSGGNPVTMPADLIFTSDAGGSTLIPWEIDFYDGSNGILWVWVFISSVSSSADTVFYMSYGDVSVTTQQNTSSLAPANVWDSNYKGIYHLPNGSSLLANDSTSNGNNGTVNQATAQAGKIDGGALANTGGTTPNITLTNNSGLDISGGDWTVEGWFSPSSNPNSYLYPASFNKNGLEIEVGVSSTYQMSIMVNNAIYNHSSSQAAGVWTHFVATRTGTTYNIYTNGALDNAGIISDSGYTSEYSLGGGYSDNIGDPYTGGIDEARVSTTVRSADWITSEYNNQNNPESFSVVGSEILNSVVGPFPTHISS